MKSVLDNITLSMNRVIYISLLLLLLVGCSGPQINPSAKHHIYLQNRDNVIKSTVIYLDQRLIFKGNVPTASYMPPVVRTLPVDDLNQHKEISVIFEGKRYSQALNSSTVEILINYDFPEYLIQQYDRKIPFK